MTEPDENPAEGSQTELTASMRWLAARNMLGTDAAVDGVTTYLEIIDHHARIVLEARA